MNPVGVVIALAVCFVVALLAQKHGRRIGYDQGITDRVQYCARMRRLKRERDEFHHGMHLAVDAFDRQRELADRRFAELVECDLARYRLALTVQRLEEQPSRIVVSERAS